jgi:hypothetical protein
VIGLVPGGKRRGQSQPENGQPTKKARRKTHTACA